MLAPLILTETCLSFSQYVSYLGPGHLLLPFLYSSCGMTKAKTVYSPGVFYHKGYANMQTWEEHQGACEKTVLLLGI